MNSKLLAGMMVVTCCFNVLAVEQKCEVVAQEKWADVFAGKAVVIHFSVSAEQPFSGRMGWQYTCEGRTIARGERVVSLTAGKNDTVEVQLQTPAVKDSVVLQTALSVSLYEENSQKSVASAEKTLWVFPENAFAGRTAWLKKLNILLFDPDGKTAAVFTKAGIPFKETKNVSALADLKDGLIVVAEGASFKEYRGLAEAMMKAASSGIPVFCLGAAGGEIQIPGMGVSELPQPERMIFKRTDVISDLDKRLDAGAWYPDARAVVSSMVVKGERGPVTGEMVSGETGWPWVELGYGGKGSVLVICGFGIVNSWETGPAPRYLLVNLLEYTADSLKK